MSTHVSILDMSRELEHYRSVINMANNYLGLALASVNVSRFAHQHTEKFNAAEQREIMANCSDNLTAAKQALEGLYEAIGATHDSILIPKSIKDGHCVRASPQWVWKREEEQNKYARMED